jgi:molybdopterin molybdotransferase
LVAKHMISVNEAKEIIQEIVQSLAPLRLPLHEASGLVLAEDIYAPTDIPAFEQSSMDGYALKFSEKDNSLIIKGEMAAGTSKLLSLQANEAARIFTGAALPDGADTVVMQEKVRVAENKLIIEDPLLQAGSNVRHKGAEVKEGALAMCANTYLSAAAIGFLAGIGLSHVPVFPRPTVSIILTGNELQQPGTPLEFGQVYEANSVMLRVALEQAGVKDIQVFRAPDDLQALQNVLTTALEQSDLVLLTGGVSVGDYDFVVQAAENCGVVRHFHKIKQKPGKPLFFGSKENKIVFGLPGNPSSVLTCFYQYVLPAIEAMLIKPECIEEIQATLSHDYPKAPGLTHFLKARYQNGKVTPLHAQESFRLHSFAQADCFIVLEEGHGDYKAGDQVKVHLLPL